MKITSGIRTKSFLKFTLFEHAMVTVLLGAGIPAMLFFGIMMSSRRNSESSVDMFDTVFTNEGVTLMVIVAVVAVLVNLLVIAVRNIALIVSAELDDTNQQLRLEVRGRRRSSLKVTMVPYSRLNWRKYDTPKIPAVPSYTGYELFDGASLIGCILTDHFTWDDQARKTKNFISELNERGPLWLKTQDTYIILK